MASQPSSPPFPGYDKYTHYIITNPGPFVAHVQINRPEKLNAFKRAMWVELRDIFAQLSVDRDVRAVVLSGAGDRAFTAGLDVQAAAESESALQGSGDHGKMDVARLTTVRRREVLDFQDCISAVERCEKREWPRTRLLELMLHGAALGSTSLTKARSTSDDVVNTFLAAVICILHGISIGLAIDLSTCCDVRICAADTRFAVKEVDIGLAADIGTLSRLPKAVGSFSWVKDVCLSARFFDAKEALSVGLVSQVHESKAAAVEAGLKMATLLSSKSPVAVQGTKELLNHARDHTVDESRFIISVPQLVDHVTGRCSAKNPQVYIILPFGTLPCCNPTMFRQRCCQASRRGNQRSRSCRRLLLCSIVFKNVLWSSGTAHHPCACTSRVPTALSRSS